MNQNRGQEEREKSIKDEVQQYESFEEKLKPPGAIGAPGDEIVASIEAPVGDKAANKRSRVNSFERKKSSEREVIDYKKSGEKRLGY